MTPLLQTPRLRLRGVSLGDAARLAALLNNFAIAGNLTNVPHPYALEDAKKWLATWRADAEPINTNFVIDLHGIGAIGVIGFREKSDIASLGYWLGEPYWGQGIMSEATRLALEWYFTETGDEEVTSSVFHFNMASLAIQQKLGFVETGRSMRHCLARNEEVEQIDTELTLDAFEQVTQKRLAWA